MGNSTGFPTVTVSMMMTILLVGCGSAPRVVQETYFKPVVRRVAAMTPVRQPSVAERETVLRLETALASSREEATALRARVLSLQDSLATVSAGALRQQAFAQALADRLAVLEQRVQASLAAAAPDADRRQTIVLPKSPGVKPPAATPLATPARTRPATMTGRYNEGVGLFRKRQYEDARRSFVDLLHEGIEEDLADNCEYWIGECEYAVGHLTEAAESFERVANLSGSNKRSDALLMYGRSMEGLRQFARARAAYERIVREYGSSPAAGFARRRLDAWRPKNADGASALTL